MDEKNANPDAPFDLDGFYEARVFGDMTRSDVRAMIPMMFIGNEEEPVFDPARPLRFFSAVKVILGPQNFTVPFEIHAETIRGALVGAVAQGREAAEKFARELDEERLRARLLHANTMPGFPGASGGKPN